MHLNFIIRRSLKVVLPALLLTSCSGLKQGSALTETSALVHERTGADVAMPRTQLEQRDVDARIASLLGKPLSAASAVQIALLNNKQLHATLEELNLSHADLLEASQLRNPSLATSLRFPKGGGGSNSEFALTGDVLDWLLTPLRRKMAMHEYEATKRRVSHEVLNLATEVKIAFYTVQAQQQFLHKLETAAEVNNVSSDIAKRLHQAGNINSLEMLQEQTSAQQVALDLKRSKGELRTAREKINRLLGLSSLEASRWSFVENLPALPSHDPSSSKAEALALTQRQDLAAKNETVIALAQSLSLKKKTRLIPGLNLGVDTERDSDGTHLTGPTLDVELPIFNRGQAKMLRAEAELAQARATLEALQSEVSSEVRMAIADVQSARETYDHLTTILVPQRQKILAETLLHYNAMQVSNFVLLRAKEDVITAEREAINALHAYWTAHAELENAVGGSLTTKPASSAHAH